MLRGKGEDDAARHMLTLAKMADVFMTDLSKDKTCLFYSRTKCVPRSKHSTLVIQNQSVRQKTQFVVRSVQKTRRVRAM
jgi:hypothetical protein